MSKKKTLFDDDSGEEEETLKINQDYATKYEEWRRGEELQKLKDRYGEDGILTSDSETSSDGDFVEPDNPKFDHDFLLTLGALHKKNDLDLEGSKFFTGDYKNKKKEKEEKAMTIWDYERHIIVDRGGELDNENDPVKEDHGEGTEQDKKLTALDDDESSDDDGDGLLSSGLFRVKENPQKNKKEESSKDVDDAIAFVKGESSAISNAKDKDLLEGLRDAWRDPHLSRDDKWLADFFLNKRYLEDDDETIERAYNEAVIDEETLSEDEKTLQKMETFETKYRFRYEEPDDEFIKKYPRIIPDSVRASDDQRKLKRKALKQRKLEEKELKRLEIQKLKALKYKEIEAKIEKIKEASGNMDIDLGDKELDEDFDPAAYDSKMSHMFGEDYYEVDDGNTEKPVFSDDEDIIKDYDDWMEKQGINIAGKDANSGGEDENEGADWEGAEDFNMDADYDPNEAKETLQQEIIKASCKKKCRRKSKFAKAIGRRKPVFDPNEKNFDSYFDEYYQLDFEDIVGGTPCRFKYRKVECNDFGLSTEEILSAQDRELNRWYSLKKMLKYQRSHEEEHIDRSKYRNRASRLHIKQKILPSLFVKNPEEQQIIEQEKKREKNRKKKLRREQRRQGNVEQSINPLITEEIKALSDENKIESYNKEPHDMSRELLTKKKRDGRENGLQYEENLQTSKTKALVNETTEDSSNRKLFKDECGEWPKKMKKKKKKKKKEEEEEEGERDVGHDDFNSIENKMTEAFSEKVKDIGNVLPFEDEQGEWPKKKRAAGQDELESEENIKIVNDRNLTENTEVGGRSLLKRRKKDRIDGVPDSLNAKDTADVHMSESGCKVVNLKKKKKKKNRDGQKVPLVKKKKKPVDNNCDIPFFQGISDSRLAAYGENPKKLKNKVKYGKRDL